MSVYGAFAMYIPQHKYSPFHSNHQKRIQNIPISLWRHDLIAILGIWGNWGVVGKYGWQTDSVLS